MHNGTSAGLDFQSVYDYMTSAHHTSSKGVIIALFTLYLAFTLYSQSLASMYEWEIGLESVWLYTFLVNVVLEACEQTDRTREAEVEAVSGVGQER